MIDLTFKFLDEDGILAGLEFNHGMMAMNSEYFRYYKLELGLIFIRVGLLIRIKEKGS